MGQPNPWTTPPCHILSILLLHYLLNFSDAEDLREIRLGSPPTRAPNEGGVVKIGDFRQIAGYISNTVKDRHIVSIKVE